ncbi:MAG: hypothetical protein R3D67_03780 [Hyphomicrobiaceae bacterium]
MAANDLGLALALVEHHDRHIASRSTQVGFHDLQRKAVATPASKALPPRSSMAIPTAVPIQWVEVTTPNVPSICGRVVNAPELMLAMIRSPIADWLAGCGYGGAAERCMKPERCKVALVR